jgi:hypothetical protein
MMVSESDRTSLAALGFLRVGQLFGQSIDDRIDDRIDTVSKAFLGLTVSCARCHDHKFDPLYTRDYYAWHGIFNSSEDMDVDLIPRELIAGHAEYAQERAEIELDTKTQARKGLERFLSNYVGQTATLLLAAQKFIDGETQATAIAAAAREFGIEADIFEAWVCALQKWQTEANRVFIPWFKLKQFSPEEYERIRDGEWGVHPIVARRLWQQQPINREALATFYSQLAAETEVLAQGHFPLAELIVNWRNLQRNWIAEEYDAFHDAPAPLEDPALEELRQVLLGFEGPWGGPQLPPQKLLRSGAAASRDQIKMTDFALIKKDGEDPRAPVMAMAMRDVPLPQNSHEFIRGDRSNLGEEAPRGYLAHFTTIDQEPYVTGSGRYQLARDIAHRDNPLTARVIVNRVWQWNFGVGLVSTPSDFGLGGIAPSHPELLDWLASWFIEHDWSIKQLNRLIVTSNTYQQASHPREEGEAIDPSNRLLWRFTPRQLSYEESLDSLLMSSGELDLAVGGRSIPQADESQRRTVFLYVDRYELPHRYRVFDFANPDFSTGTRESSIVSPQALYFLNDNWIFARAQHLSHIIATPSTKTDDKVMVLWKAIYRREPTDEELQLACTLLKDSGEDFAGLVHALMCTNEFIFVR